jgi:hypothetical protein
MASTDERNAPMPLPLRAGREMMRLMRRRAAPSTPRRGRSTLLLPLAHFLQLREDCAHPVVHRAHSCTNGGTSDSTAIATVAANAAAAPGWIVRSMIVVIAHVRASRWTQTNAHTTQRQCAG